MKDGAGGFKVGEGQLPPAPTVPAFLPKALWSCLFKQMCTLPTTIY